MTDLRILLPLEPGPDRDLVRAVVAELTDDEQTVVVLSYAAHMLPIADLSGRLRRLGLLRENSLLTELGDAVAAEIVRCDPDATDPHQRAAS